VRNLAERGHEIACHTLSHLNARRVSRELIKRDVEANQRAAMSLGLSLRNFAYPFGQISLRHKSFVGSQYQTARTNLPGVNRHVADANCLLAMSLSPHCDFRLIRTRIDDVAEFGGWLILYTHDVAREPGNGGITPRQLKEFVAAAVGSGAKTMNIAEAVSVITARRAGATPALASAC
jgi:peptidoglycan/xylan/chitin deacetylase (PgdA/CDA1 family)